MRRMPSRFRHAAIVGKYQARGIRPLLEEIAQFLVGQGLDVSFERDTAQATGVTDFDIAAPGALGISAATWRVVVGGDGTMLGIARDVARQDLPLVGINQGRLGFITDVPARPLPRRARRR
jgi:NAD+ kinase